MARKPTDREQQLLAEYARQAQPVGQAAKGKPAKPVEPAPVRPPDPVFLPRADDDEPSAVFSLGLNRCYTNGQLRGLAHHEALSALARDFNNAQWAWKQRQGLVR